MKRRYVVLGLMILLFLVLLVALAGPANAKTGQWTHFDYTMTVDMTKWVPPTAWPLWKAEDPYTPEQPFVPVRTINEFYYGTFASDVPEFNGDAVTETNGTATVQGNRSMPSSFTLRYINKTTVDIADGEWEIIANGLYFWDYRTTPLPSFSHTLVGRGRGVSGSVKGWVMYFTADLTDLGPGDPVVAEAYYMEK